MTVPERNERRVRCPVRADDAARLAALHVACSAPPNRLGGQWFLGERHIHDACPADAATRPTQEGELEVAPDEDEDVVHPERGSHVRAAVVLLRAVHEARTWVIDESVATRRVAAIGSIGRARR